LNHIFHYHVTAFLALKAGFSVSAATTLAHASQFVDNALIPYRVVSDKIYDVAHTHHFGFWSHEQEDSIWIPFHFFPAGEPVASFRLDGLENAWGVRPHSSPVTELLLAAFKTDDLYRIGIALHTFSDSWAHQNFTGRKEDFNRVPGSIPIPPIGHAQVESVPDIFSMRWSDFRLHYPRIDNRTRFLESSRFIYQYLTAYLKKNFSDVDQVMSELEILVGPISSEKEAHTPLGLISSQIQKGIYSARTKARNFADNLFSRGLKYSEHQFSDSFPLLCGLSDKELEKRFYAATNIIPYDRRKWRNEAFIDERNFLEDTLNNATLNDKISWIQHEIFSRSGLQVAELKVRKNFFSSDLFQWSEAAYAHRREAQHIIRNI